ncbi:unnamed protein product [Adineta ricciae]|uniref:Uncharacterized protein n=1 Tax=Adineta ricciae TaxID=249248 RepID=A0A814WKB5_ADIRI|nr:unnamed protein product [Adineta ricciae]
MRCTHFVVYTPTDKTNPQQNEISLQGKVMKSTPFTPMRHAQGQFPGLSSEILVFGIILCRLDVSAGDRRRAQYGIRIEN